MEKVSLTIEIEAELQQKIEEIAEQMGVSAAEWCAFAISQQIMMQEQMENLFDQVGQIGIDLGQLDFESITNQLFNQVIEVDSLELEEEEIPSKLILPDYLKNRTKDE